VKILRRNWLLPVIGVLALVALPVQARTSEFVLLHGHIYTADPKHPWAEAMAISGARIDAMGASKDIVRRQSHATQVIDLHGRTVIPGIVDSHMHMWFGALELNGFNLSTPTGSITADQPQTLIARIRDYAAQHPNDKILFGRVDFSSTPPYSPTHDLLDQAVNDRPVVIHSPSEHALWVNAKALALAGISDRPVTDVAEEAGVFRDASGYPTGVLIEAGMELIERAALTQLTEDEKLARLAAASRYLNRYGITSIVNATGDLASIRLLGLLRDRDQLTVRTRTAFGAVAVPHRLTPQFLADLDEARSTYHDEWVSANLVKFFLDGGTGLLPPLVYQSAQYKNLVIELDRRGYQLMTHAQRTDTIHLALDAYEAASRANGPRDRRFRIEHDMLASTADIARFAQGSVIASMQPVFCCSEVGSNFDPKETAPSDRWRSFLDHGVTLAFNSDWPGSFPPDPFVGIQQAVMRDVWTAGDTANVMGQTLDGAGQGGAHDSGQPYSPQERISVREAIDAYTRGSAYASFMDDRVGTLTPGKLADLAVLSQDVFAVPALQISATRVVMTMVGGKIVYRDIGTL
jgi:predicted amidohydrolase YtcJ